MSVACADYPMLMVRLSNVPFKGNPLNTTHYWGLIVAPVVDANDVNKTLTTRTYHWEFTFERAVGSPIMGDGLFPKGPSNGAHSVH